MSHTLGWTRLTHDAIVRDGPAMLFGLVLLTSVTGGDATVYDGVDATAGRQIARFEGIANESRPVFFPYPLRLERGLYLDVGSNVTEVLLLWLPE